MDVPIILREMHISKTGESVAADDTHRPLTEKSARFRWCVGSLPAPEAEHDRATRF
jgi:hypothetical protein